jgi:HTH-type transcriptional regulator / antitoxin HigA
MIATVPEKYTLKNVDTPTAITSEEQYDDYVEVLMSLDKKGSLNRHEESYAKILTAFIDDWDEKQHPIDDASPVEVLRTLIEANDLRQKDLVSIFGTESIVSEVLNEKRALTVDHIIGLSQRFHVSPAVFIHESKAAPKRNPKRIDR